MPSCIVWARFHKAEAASDTMIYKLSDLFDIGELQDLSESFTKLTGAVTAILDLEGNILTATGWQPVCTRFHRIHPKTAVRCRESDTVLASRLNSGEKYNVYRCKNGLIDVAVPIVIDGIHMGNLFTGQFFFESPDVEYFMRQAREFGFDEREYFEELSKVPIFTEEYVKTLMDFLLRLVELICNMGMPKKRALDMSERLFSYYMDNIDAYVYIKDKNSNYVFINKKTEELFNTTRSALRERDYTDYDFFDKRMAERLRENDRYVIDTGSILESEEIGDVEGNQNAIFNIGKRYYLTLKFPFRDGKDAISGVCGFSHDITERKIMEEEIQIHSEILLNMSEGVFLIRADNGTIVYTNPKLDEMFCYERNELLSKHVSILNAPSDTLPEERANEIISSLLEKGTWEGEVYNIKKNGTPFWCNATVSTFKHHKYGNVWISIHTDITERKKMRRELDKIFDLSLDMMCVADISGYFRRVNVAFEKTLGYTIDEVLSKPILEFIHPDDREATISAMEDLALGQTVEHFVNRYACKDGTYKFIEWSSYPIPEHGITYAVARDITMRKELEESLRLNEARLEALIKLNMMEDKPLTETMEFVLERSISLTNSVIGFISFTNEDETVYINQAYSKSVMKECDFINNNAHYLIESAGMWAEAIRLRRPVIINDYETTHFIKKGYPKGHVSLKSLMVVPAFEHDKIVAVMAVGNKETDYTQADLNQITLLINGMWEQIVHRRMNESLKSSNKYNRNLIETSLDPLVTITDDGKIGDVNKATEIITGYSRDELIGTDFSDYFTEPEKAKAGYRRVFEDGEVRDYELSIRDRDGHSTPVLYNASVYKDDTGKVTGVFAAARDITTTKQMESKLKELNRTLEMKIQEEIENSRQKEQMLIQQSKMAAMGEMINSIAHQWKQPLNVISLIVQDLRDAYTYGELDNEYVKRSEQTIMQQIQFMVKTIDDFRNFLRPSKEKTLFDIKKAIEELISMFSSLFVKSSIKLKLNHIDNKDFNVLGYPNEFKQVILNVINNSRDAILTRRENRPSGSELEDKIEINLLECNDKRVVCICDTGGGIPGDIVDKIFEPYFTTKSADKGTGIGLYMSKTIIENNMGWKLSVSNKEVGAEFRIEI
ncbi:MAG: PAS domain S-box protein [Nitrospirae bacterium]|nr:PAS domain S-box protein [Nitrospirota bacterium]